MFLLLLKCCNWKLVTRDKERKIKNAFMHMVYSFWFETPCSVCTVRGKMRGKSVYKLSVLKILATCFG
jgi:hypothetical protein